MYKIIFSNSAKHSLKKLPVQIVRVLSEKIDALTENPRPSGCKKLVGSNIWRVRAGDYRILYSIDDKIMIVDIRAIGHRKDIYS